MKRILTGIILSLLIVGLVLYAPLYLMVTVQLAFALVGVWEYFRLAESAHVVVLRYPGYLFALALSVLPLRAITGDIVLPVLGFDFAVWIVALAVLFLGVLMVAGMRPSRMLPDYLGSVAGTFLGPIYVAAPLTLLVSVWMEYEGPYRVLFFLVVIWAGDTSAYFVGKYLGRHKCSPRVSPNKTWEGTIASFLAALLVGVVTAKYFGSVVRVENGYMALLILAAALNVAGQFGDLAESALKRSAGVKDSSNLIPGHGGVLDRIDALLFAAPVLWCYYWFWRF